VDLLEGDNGDGENGALPAEGDSDLIEYCAFDGDRESECRISRMAECAPTREQCVGEWMCRVPPASRWGEHVNIMLRSMLLQFRASHRYWLLQQSMRRRSDCDSVAVKEAWVALVPRNDCLQPFQKAQSLSTTFVELFFFFHVPSSQSSAMAHAKRKLEQCWMVAICR